MGSVIAVFGLSGVGKSHMIGKFVRGHPHFLHAQASQLIKSALGDRSLGAERLRTAAANDILKNQELLVEAFGEVRRNAKETPIIFDGHSVIYNDAELVRIPVEVVRRIEPALLIFLRAEPAEISTRRALDPAKKRPARTHEQLMHEQSIALEMCEDYATTLQVPLAVFHTSDEAGFANAIRGLSQQSPAN